MNKIRIALVSPSGTFAHDKLSAALDQASSIGLEIVSATDVRTGMPEFLNGSWEMRLKELEDAEQETVDGIWCVRGGVGAIELWPHYHESIFANTKAPLIGYSDITIYHFLRFLRAKRIGIHGPIFLDLLKTDPALIEAIGLLISGHAERLVYPALTNLNHSFADTISGELLPMNLASLQTIIGCFDAEILRGKILAIEDINEQPYKVFRMMQQLKNARMLAGLKALIVGHFADDRQKVIETVIEPLAEVEGIPLFDWPIFGHAQPNWPLMFGAKVTLNRIDDPYFTLVYNEQHDHTAIIHELP